MINYKNLYDMGLQFRRVERSGFNITDSPDIRFFKLLFYFYNNIEDASTVSFYNGGPTGLLAPTWLDNPTGDYYKYNSAWAYLKSNYEEERADALKDFIVLLSRVSSESPWYFKEVSGVDEALIREKWRVGGERKKISIKCMPDPVDRRIESLLSLYRSIVWSQSRKCEVLPANLRKFDMGMYLFSGFVDGVTHTRTTEETWMEIDGDSTTGAPYKYVEFHNCEISMDSIKSGYSGIGNESGFVPEFIIDIYFDECYEQSYNPYLLKCFGDFFTWDMWGTGRKEDGNITGDIPEFASQTTIDGTLDRFASIKRQARDIINGMINDTKNIVSNAVTGGLGNIHSNGYGVNGVIDATQQTISQQMKSISTRLMGNINNTVIGTSRVGASLISEPISNIPDLGSLIPPTSGNLVGVNRLSTTSKKLGKL